MTLNSKEVLLLKRIKEDSSYNNWFFKEAKETKWFYHLKDEGYFLPERILAVPNVLDYLERISIQIKDGNNEEYGKEFLEIIDNTVKFAGNTKNYYVWWYFVKIINHLPVSILEEGFKKYDFNTWLTKWTDPLGADLAVSDIGRNLLGKFLEADSTIKYAEMIIDVITKVRPNEKEVSSFGKESAILRWQPYWVVDSLKKYDKKIGSKCSIETVLGIADKLKKSLEYKKQDCYVHLEVDENFYRVEVFRVSNDTDKKEVDFKENIYSCSVKQFSNEQVEGKDIKNEAWILQTIDSPSKELKSFLVNAATEEEFIVALKKQLPSDINWLSCVDLDKKIGFLFDGLFEDYSYIWFKSFTDNRHIHPTDAEEVLTVVLRDILLSKCQTDPVQGIKILEKFLTDKYLFSVFRRLVLFFVNQNWSTYGKLLNQFLAIKPNPFHKSDYEIELYDIFLNQNAQFDEELREKIKSLIDDVPELYVKTGVKAIAHWQHKWLSPLKNNPSFSDIFIKVKEESEIKGDYQPDRSTFEDGLVVHKTPILEDDILNKSIPDLIQYLKEFKAPSWWEAAFDGLPDKEGLTQTLQSAVKKNPKKFIDEIELFKQEGLYRYVNSILWAFRDVWRAGVIAKSEFVKADTNGDAVLNDLIKKDILEEASSLEVRLKWNNEEPINRPEEIEGSNFDQIWSTLQEFRLGKLLDWKRVLQFCLSYIQQPQFIDEAATVQGEDRGKFKGQYIWLIDTIVGLIEDGSRDDKKAFDNSNFDKVEEIFDTLLPYVQGEQKPDTQRSAINYAINTTLGKLIESYIIYSLHVARVYKKQDEWGINKYERFFVKGIEAHIFFGRLIMNLRYLDQNYVDKKIVDFSQGALDDFQWSIFMESYLCSAHLPKILYLAMRAHYLRALEYRDFERKIDDLLVEHMCFGYLHYGELLQEKNADRQPSLFWKMLHEAGVLTKQSRWLK